MWRSMTSHYNITTRQQCSVYGWHYDPHGGVYVYNGMHTCMVVLLGGGRFACVCLWTRPLTTSYKGFFSTWRHRDLSNRAVRTRANALQNNYMLAPWTWCIPWHKHKIILMTHHHIIYVVYMQCRSKCSNLISDNYLHFNKANKQHLCTSNSKNKNWSATK